MAKMKVVKLTYDLQEKFWMVLNVLWNVGDKKFDMDLWNLCAIGHCVKHPFFKKAGLRLVDGTPKYRENVSPVGALQDFFGVDFDTLSECFGYYHSGKTAEEMAVKIEKWLLACEKKGVKAE